MKAPYTLSPEQAKLIDLVRRLEKDGYDFGVDIVQIEATLKKETAEPLEKIALRAEELDDGTLFNALRRVSNRTKLIPTLIGIVCCLTGVAISSIVLVSGLVSIFYLLPLVIIAHTALMIHSFIAYRHAQGELPFDKLFERLSPNDEIDRHAYAIALDEHHSTHYWHAIGLIQLKWLATMTGVLLGVLVAYVLQAESFIWQATSHHGHKALIAELINLIPQFLGSRLDDVTNTPNQLIYFSVVSILIYTIVPRAVAWAVCQFHIYQTPYRINTSLYYYDDLYRKFSHKISDEAGYIPYNAKPVQAHIDQNIQKITATLGRPAIDETWYRFGAGFLVYDFGVLTNETLEQLIATIELKNKPVYLGVFADNFPDDDSQALILAIKNAAPSLSIEIIKVVEDDNHNYFNTDWEQFLSKMALSRCDMNDNHIHYSQHFTQKTK